MVLAEDEQVVEYGENGWEMISGKSHKMGIPKSHVKGKVELQSECIVGVSHDLIKVE
jgi:hypothetical protein